MMEISTFLGHHQEDTPNILQVKALYKAMREADKEALTKLLVDEPVWNVSPGNPEGGVHRGMAQIFRSFYPKVLSLFHSFGAVPDVYIDGGDVVNVLGHYKFKTREGDPYALVRFSHTWGIAPDGRIKGVWQVADSAQFFIPDKVDSAGAQSGTTD